MRILAWVPISPAFPLYICLSSGALVGKKAVRVWGQGILKSQPPPFQTQSLDQKLTYYPWILQPPSKMLSSILGKSNLQFAGMSISLTISTASLNLRTPDSKQVCGCPGSPSPRVDIPGAPGSELTEPVQKCAWPNLELEPI